MPRSKITDGLRQKANGSWERSEYINGKRRWFADADPAKVWEKRDAAIRQIEIDEELRSLGPTFNEVADVYEEQVRNMKNGTQKSYLPAIKRARDYFGSMRMKDIEPYAVATFLQTVTSMARTTVSNQKTVLNGIFQIWIESPEWRGDRNPAKLARLPKGLRKTKRLPPTEEQVQIVKDHYLDPDALIAVLFLCTGERKGEACGIQVKDIDFENGIIYIRKAVEHIGNRPHITVTKTEAGIRKIPLLDMLREALEPFRDADPEMFILSGRTTPLTESQYKRKWVDFWRKHNMAHPIEREYTTTRASGTTTYLHHDWQVDVSAHQFRHEYVCMLCTAGVPEDITIQLVGHANAKMIHEVYMSLTPKMVTLAKDKLNAFLNS